MIFACAARRPARALDARTGFRADCTSAINFQGDGDYASFGNHLGLRGLSFQGGDEAAAQRQVNDRGLPRAAIGRKKSKIRALHDSPPTGLVCNFRQIPIKSVFSCRTFQKSGGVSPRLHDVPLRVAESTNLANLDLPKMVDCVNCHDISKTLGANFRMSNCEVCHVDDNPAAMPELHSSIVKPPSHTEAFRLHHGDEASQPGAPCFVCHMNVAPSAVGQQECIGCHEVMMPVSHTARWKDDVHGKYAALDRTTCTVCHVTDYCSRCHNETPRSHMPLAQFKAGGHAQLAMFNEGVVSLATHSRTPVGNAIPRPSEERPTTNDRVFSCSKREETSPCSQERGRIRIFLAGWHYPFSIGCAGAAGGLSASSRIRLSTSRYACWLLWRSSESRS